MPKIVIDIPETVYDYALGLPDKTTLSSYGVYPVLTDIAYIVKNGTPLEEVLEEEYRRGWEDAICKALKETHDYYTEDGVFRAIQEESLIGVGMIMDDKHINGENDNADTDIDK